MISVAHDRLLRLADVLEIVGLSKAMIYRLVKRGTFPKQVKAGCSSSRWSEAEVRAWVADRAAARAA